MSASQPLSLVTDHGTLTSANATTAVTAAKTIKSGVLYVTCSDEKKAGNIVACNTATQAGVGSFHIAKGDSFLYRYGHPARGTVTAASKANPCVLTLNHPDSKIRVGDYITMSGAAVGAWNTLIAHVPVTAVSSPQQWNDYQQTITVTANSSALADFTGTASIEKSVIFRLAPETSDGCTLHISEVGIG